ncbi:MAG: YqgE/AlgH family protein [Myxococcota bacterium]|nr:YqgE/AlgH family protein [Myxococcota bacterium]
MAELNIAPGFLVAAPQLKDPNFENSVILMIDHKDEEGALGLVINQRAKVDFGTVLSEMKLDAPERTIDASKHPPLLCGGPVSQEQGWILHTEDWQGPETRTVVEGLCVTSSLDVLTAIVADQGPKKYRFCLGYAGWGPHQLIGEIKKGAWINMPLSVDLIFDVPIEDIWMACFSRLGINPMTLVGIVADA